MHHIASVIVFRIKNTTKKPIKVSSVEFTAPVKIAGKFNATINLKSSPFQAPNWSADKSNAVSTVSLSVNNGTTLDSGETGDFYMAVHPFSSSGQYSIKVKASQNGKTVTSEKTANQNFTFTAGKYKVVEYDFVFEEQTPKQSLNIENKHLQSYLDEVYAHPYLSGTAFASWNSSYSSTLMTPTFYKGGNKDDRYDQPAPVVLVWSGNATHIDVFSDHSKIQAVASQDIAGDEYANIYNLIPGHHYYYTVTDNSDVIDEGDFTPQGRRRMIAVSSTYADTYACNCRDLGGLKTNDGKKVKYGRIYRGSNIDGIPKDKKALDIFLNTMNIDLDVDLREKENKKNSPDLTQYGVVRSSESYTPNISDLTDKAKMKSTLTQILTFIADGKNVYIHCRIGSDRTGYVCLLLESLLGVTQNECDIDYEITSFANAITGVRTRTEKNPEGGSYHGGKYGNGLQFLANFNGTTLADKVYDYVVTSENGLQIDSSLIEKFRKELVE